MNDQMAWTGREKWHKMRPFANLRVVFDFFLTFVGLIMAHFSSFQIGQARDGAGLEAVCAVSNQTKHETYELKQLKWLGQTSTSHTSMALKHFGYHSRSQTHDAMNSAHSLFWHSLGLNTVQSMPCWSRIWNISMWHFVAKNDLSKWKNDWLPMAAD